jgi:ABC-2 type transport system ATP-binding protein
VRPEYETVEAVRSISFRVKPGERVAFIGPNGAGKSTTIKMLTGILHPTDGHAEVQGMIPWKDRAKLSYRIGSVFGQRSQLWYHLPAEETFNLFAAVYDLDRSQFLARKKELIALFELEPLLKKAVRQLSLGERMRCEIAASMLHRPDVLLLDEPSIGLDVTAKAVIRDLVRERSEQEGTTVLLTSHDTGDMEQVCDRVIVINHGSLLLDSPINTVRQAYIKEKIVTIQTADEHVDIELAGVSVIERRPHNMVLRVHIETTPIEEVVLKVIEGSRLRDLTVEDPPLEDVIKKLYADGALLQSAGEHHVT